jgi:hypothetical protein
MTRHNYCGKTKRNQNKNKKIEDKKRMSTDTIDVKVKFTLQQATKTQRGSRVIAILFP